MRKINGNIIRARLLQPISKGRYKKGQSGRILKIDRWSCVLCFGTSKQQVPLSMVELGIEEYVSGKWIDAFLKGDKLTLNIDHDRVVKVPHSSRNILERIVKQHQMECQMFCFEDGSFRNIYVLSKEEDLATLSLYSGELEYERVSSALENLVN